MSPARSRRMNRPRRALHRTRRWWLTRGLVTKALLVSVLPIGSIVFILASLLALGVAEAATVRAQSNASDARSSIELLLVGLLDAETGVRGYDTVYPGDAPRRISHRIARRVEPTDLTSVPQSMSVVNSVLA